MLVKTGVHHTTFVVSRVFQRLKAKVTGRSHCVIHPTSQRTLYNNCCTTPRPSLSKPLVVWFGGNVLLTGIHLIQA